MDNIESRSNDLTSQVVEKWFRENTGSKLHLEVFNQDTLNGLMLSRIRKLSREINEEHSREPMPITTESLDEIFDSITELLTPVNPKVAGEKEKAAAKEAADRAQLNAEADFMLAIMQYEKAVGQRGVSEWYHKKATKQQKEWYDRLFSSGAVTPEQSAPQSNLFVVKATFNDGRVKYISGDTNPVPLDSTVAHRFGRTNAQNFANTLATQRPELKRIEIVPLEGAFAVSAKDFDINATASALNQEALEAYLQKR
jgi:hypothetical protein